MENSAPPFFKEMTALVTGASVGIGNEFARELARQGANVILVARSKDRLEDLAEELRKNFPVKVFVYVADLEKCETPRQIFDWAQAQKLDIDLLVNNAGFGRYGPFKSQDEKMDQQMIALNIESLVMLTHLFIPGMLARKKGGVINVASTAGFQPIPYMPVYGASKAFVISFSEALWAEYEKQGVRILCVCPGNTTTEFHLRAKTQKRNIFWIATAGEVARHGLKVFRTGRQPTTIYGWINFILATGHRFLPRSAAARLARIVFKPSGPEPRQ